MCPRRAPQDKCEGNDPNALGTQPRTPFLTQSLGLMEVLTPRLASAPPLPPRAIRRGFRAEVTHDTENVAAALHQLTQLRACSVSEGVKEKAGGTVEHGFHEKECQAGVCGASSCLTLATLLTCFSHVLVLAFFCGQAPGLWAAGRCLGVPLAAVMGDGAGVSGASACGCWPGTLEAAQGWGAQGGCMGSGWGRVNGPLAAHWAAAGRSLASLFGSSKDEMGPWAQQPGPRAGFVCSRADFLMSMPLSSWARVAGISRFPDIFGFLGKSHDQGVCERGRWRTWGWSLHTPARPRCLFLRTHSVLSSPHVSAGRPEDRPCGNRGGKEGVGAGGNPRLLCCR